MSFGSPDPPTPPNPYAVASAQQQANVSVAIANTFMTNSNVVSPQGTSTFAQTGTYTLSDPQYDTAGALVGTTDRDIPIFTQTIALTTVGQQIYDANQQLQLATNNLGVAQIGSLNTQLSSPFTTAGLPTSATNPSAPTLVDTITTARSVQQNVGGNTSVEREAAIAAVVSRLEFQSSLARSSRITELANMGIFAGSEAYENEMRLFDFQVTDGRLQAVVVGGQEQSRLFQIELQKGQFYNAAVDQEIKNQLILVDFGNSAAIKRFQTLMQIADFINTFRERSLQESLAARNQPLNELSTLLRGGQIAIPAYTGFKSGQVSDTPLASSVYASANLEQQNYQSKVSQQNAMIGGLAALGGAILGAPMTGGGSVGGNLLGGLLK